MHMRHKGRMSMRVIGCCDARLSAARRNEEHRRSSESRWPAGERNRSGGLLQHPHFSHIQSSPLLTACASAELNSAYVPTFFSHPSLPGYSFIIHLKISLHAVLRLHLFNSKQVHQVCQWTVPPILTPVPFIFFHPLLSIQLSPPHPSLPHFT